MSDEVSVEAEGETVGEAKWAAVRELEQRVPGLDRAAVRFQVVTEGERGLLGVGYSPARVIASARRPERPAASPATADESDEAARVREVIERIVTALGVACTIRLDEREDGIEATLEGPSLGLLIGRHGQTIDAIQYLANAIAHRDRGTERKAVTVDASGYRARRASALEALARRAAEQASATGRRVALEPMTAVERKLVHELLKDDPEVETASDGTEPNRYVVVSARHSV
jgi:spoIIIJ-associated protein